MKARTVQNQQADRKKDNLGNTSLYYFEIEFSCSLRSCEHY